MISAFEQLKVVDLSHSLKEQRKEPNSFGLLKEGGKGKASSLSEVSLLLEHTCGCQEGTRRRDETRGFFLLSEPITIIEENFRSKVACPICKVEF